MVSSEKYKSSEELKALAKEQLFGKYGTTIGAHFIIGLITLFISNFSTIFLNLNTLYGIALNFAISFVISVLMGVLNSGQKYFYLKIVCGQPATVSDIFYGLKLYPNKAVLIQFNISLRLYIAMLPMTLLNYAVIIYPDNSVLMLCYSLSMILYLVVLCLVSINYSQVFYLLHDFPEYSVQELLSIGKKLMKGSKFRYFYMMVSFFPLLLLGLLSCGIAWLWLIPYINATDTEFFLDLIRKNQVSD